MLDAGPFGANPPSLRRFSTYGGHFAAYHANFFHIAKAGQDFCILPRFLRLFFLVKHLFDLIEEPLALLVIFLLGAAVELLQKLLLLLGEVLRDLDRHPDVLVAAAPAVDMRDALALELEHIPGWVPSRTW